MGNIQTEDPSYGTVEDIEPGIPLGQAEKVYSSQKGVGMMRSSLFSV
jgi:hypothetical protein